MQIATFYVQNIFHKLTIAFFCGFLLVSCSEPKLTILSPISKTRVSESSIEIKGNITPKDADLFANGHLVIIGSDGNFVYNALLKDSVNKIFFESVIDGHVLQEEITVYKTLSSKELKFLSEEKTKKELDFQKRQERMEKILAKRSKESVNLKYQKIIDGCYGWTSFKKKGGTLKEYTFKMTKFDETMAKRGFSKGLHTGDFSGTEGDYFVQIIYGDTVPSSQGWQYKWEILVDIDESKI